MAERAEAAGATAGSSGGDMRVKTLARQIEVVLLIGGGVILVGFGLATQIEGRPQPKRLSSFAAKNLLRQSFEVSRCPETHHQTQ